VSKNRGWISRVGGLGIDCVDVKSIHFEVLRPSIDLGDGQSSRIEAVGQSIATSMVSPVKSRC
jgi:hypothetical protein